MPERLPDRQPDVPEREQGLFRKYYVTRVDGKPVDWCFVLQDTDPLALFGLHAYALAARRAGYTALADDLYAKITELEARHNAAAETVCPHCGRGICVGCPPAQKEDDDAQA